ncbi:MAG: DUF1840 domain-containing protein [Pseudomonadota bacterium]
MITFKSSAAADIMMFDDVASRMIVLMGKEATDKGVITVEQLPVAIAKLESAINGDHEQHREHLLADDTQEVDGHGNERPFVSLTRRVQPLLEMLRTSLKESEPVIWGV